MRHTPFITDERAALRVPNHALLVAAVAVRQAATRTAQIAGRIDTGAAKADPVDALVATFLRADTVAAASALGGSFHPDVAGTTRTGPAEKAVNSPFTLAF
jgi:hypothetical protein